MQQVLKNSYKRSSLKHGVFNLSRDTGTFRSRSYHFNSQTSVTYFPNNFTLEMQRLRPLGSSNCPLKTSIERKPMSVKVNTTCTGYCSDELTNQYCASSPSPPLDTPILRKHSKKRRLFKRGSSKVIKGDPKTPTSLPECPKQRQFKFRHQMSNPCSQSSSLAKSDTPRACIVYSSSGEMVRFEMKSNETV